MLVAAMNPSPISEAAYSEPKLSRTSPIRLRFPPMRPALYTRCYQKKQSEGENADTNGMKRIPALPQGPPVGR